MCSARLHLGVEHLVGGLAGTAAGDAEEDQGTQDTRTRRPSWRLLLKDHRLWLEGRLGSC